MISMTSLSVNEDAGSAAVRVPRLALHRETVLDLIGSPSSEEKGVQGAKTHGRTCKQTCAVTCTSCFASACCGTLYGTCFCRG